VLAIFTFFCTICSRGTLLLPLLREVQLKHIL